MLRQTRVVRRRLRLGIRRRLDRSRRQCFGFWHGHGLDRRRNHLSREPAAPQPQQAEPPQPQPLAPRPQRAESPWATDGSTSASVIDCASTASSEGFAGRAPRRVDVGDSAWLGVTSAETGGSTGCDIGSTDRAARRVGDTGSAGGTASELDGAATKLALLAARDAGGASSVDARDSDARRDFSSDCGAASRGRSVQADPSHHRAPAMPRGSAYQPGGAPADDGPPVIITPIERTVDRNSSGAIRRGRAERNQGAQTLSRSKGRGIRYRLGMAVATQGEPKWRDPRTSRVRTAWLQQRHHRPDSGAHREPQPAAAGHRSCSSLAVLIALGHFSGDAGSVLHRRRHRLRAHRGDIRHSVESGRVRMGGRRTRDRHRRDHPDAARRARFGAGTAVDLPHDVARRRLRAARAVRR